jgi:nicotinic acid mononucleotide adenylyltransferase
MHPIKTEHPASATEIRMALAGGDAKDEWLHPDVAEYIRRHGLYAA